MDLALYFKNGPLKGQIIPLKKTLILGRTDGDIHIKDASVSFEHAQIRLVKKAPYIRDLNSKNKTYVNKKVIQEAPLKEGALIQLGRIEIEVRVLTEKDEDVANEIFPLFGSYLSWKGQVAAILQKAKLEFTKSAPTQMTFFEQPFLLRIISGPQKGTSWTISYGPRRFGPLSPEFPLHDSSLPHICFTIRPLDKKIVLDTKEPHLIKVNGEEVTSCSLHHKDKICLKDICLQLLLLKS